MAATTTSSPAGQLAPGCVQGAFARPDGCHGGDGRGPAAAGPGLVSSYETSSTRIRSHRGERRIGRLKRAIPLASRHAECATALGGFRYRTALVTLTYRPGETWAAWQISQVQDAYTSWLRRRGIPFRAVWVLELTKAGVPHYHLVLWLPRGITPPKPDKQGWWRHGCTRVEWARNATGYLVKYASKGTAWTSFPPGARLFGVRGLGTLWPSYRYQRRPFWLQEVTRISTRLMRRPGGWFVDRDTGQAWQSPWMLVARAEDWSWIEFGPREVAPQALHLQPRPGASTVVLTGESGTTPLASALAVSEVVSGAEPPVCLAADAASHVKAVPLEAKGGES